MPFTSGVHVACGYVGSPGGARLLGPVVWSSTMESPGVTRGAPDANEVGFGPGGSNLTFEISAAVDVFVAIGSAPNASSARGKRVLVRAGETRNLACLAGEKLAWIAA